jgi:hypothetical protein
MLHQHAHDPFEFTPPPELVADLQRICREELGEELSWGEAEDVGLRMLRLFWLMYEVQERSG